MIRRVPLRRSYIKRSPPRRIVRETPEETAYKDWLHSQYCVETGYVGPRVQASHVGSGGMGQKKGSWFDAIPMRDDIHREWEEHSGRYSGWSKEHRREVATGWIRFIRRRAQNDGLTVPDLTSDPE